jgi:hypothetical protein
MRRRVGDPGAREMFEEGSLPHGESFARALSARATLHGAKASRGERGSLAIGVPPSARSSDRTEELDGEPDVVKAANRVTWSGPRASEGVSGAAAQVHGRGSIARWVCLRVVGVAEVDGRRLAQTNVTRIPPKPRGRLRGRSLALEGTVRDVARKGEARASARARNSAGRRLAVAKPRDRGKTASRSGVGNGARNEGAATRRWKASPIGEPVVPSRGLRRIRSSAFSKSRDARESAA